MDYGSVVSNAADAFANADGQKFTVSDFETAPGSQGSLTRVLTRKSDVLTGIRQDRAPKFSIAAFESKTTDGTADNTETFSLSHDLVDSDAVVDSVEVYKDDGATVTQVQPDSVDYDADTFDFTDSGTDNDLYVFYTAGDQARVVLRKTGPKNAYGDIIELDAGLLHRRNQTKDPVDLNFGSPLGGVAPEDWRIDLYVDAPYTARFDYDGGSEPVSPGNAFVSLGVRRTAADVPGVKQAVKAELMEE
jgi:hypothetical protein